ncbi:class II fructose-bisphosphate aldolase, partial [Patescibacteria group bacterium]|nr:class II fructose-bisphosphate aldolase [Patescibacteria group bacterium]
MLVSTDKMLKKALQGGYAVGAFDVYNLEVALAHCRAAKQMKSPLIMLVSETTIKYAGLRPMVEMLTSVAKNVADDVPVALHLDHGKTFKAVVECVEAGFTSIHIDASDLPLAENIAITKQGVDYAHKNGIWAQGELGPVKGMHVAGKKFEGEIPKTNPTQVKEFIKKTGVDMLAIAVGPTHGIYTNERVDFDLLKAVKKEAGNTPLVLHGSSGVPEKEITESIKYGVAKINVGTIIRKTFTDALVETMKKKDKDMIDVRTILTP